MSNLQKIYQWLRNLGSLEKLYKIQLYEDHLRALRVSDPANLQLSGYVRPGYERNVREWEQVHA